MLTNCKTCRETAKRLKTKTACHDMQVLLQDILSIVINIQETNSFNKEELSDIEDRIVDIL